MHIYTRARIQKYTVTDPRIDTSGSVREERRGRGSSGWTRDDPCVEERRVSRTARTHFGANGRATIPERIAVKCAKDASRGSGVTVRMRWGRRNSNPLPVRISRRREELRKDTLSADLENELRESHERGKNCNPPTGLAFSRGLRCASNPQSPSSFCSPVFYLPNIIFISSLASTLSLQTPPDMRETLPIQTSSRTSWKLLFFIRSRVYNS